MTNPIHESAKRLAKEWRTIDSAPLSVPIILWDPTAGKDGASGEGQYFMRDDRNGSWHWAGGGPCEVIEAQCYPTHWMPLPAAPK